MLRGAVAAACVAPGRTDVMSLELLWHLPSADVARMLLLYVLFVHCFAVVGGVCPHCFGNFAKCNMHKSLTNHPSVSR